MLTTLLEDNFLALFVCTKIEDIWVWIKLDVLWSALAGTLLIANLMFAHIFDLWFAAELRYFMSLFYIFWLYFWVKEVHFLLLKMSVESLTPLIVEAQKQFKFTHILADAGAFGKVSSLCLNNCHSLNWSIYFNTGLVVFILMLCIAIFKWICINCLKLSLRRCRTD